MTETNQSILIKVPPQLKKELQIIAIQNETNMTEIVLQLIQEYVQQNKKNI